MSDQMALSEQALLASRGPLQVGRSRSTGLAERVQKIHFLAQEIEATAARIEKDIARLHFIRIEHLAQLKCLQQVTELLAEEAPGKWSRDDVFWMPPPTEEEVTERYEEIS